MNKFEIFIKSNDTSSIRKKLLLEFCSRRKININNIFAKHNGFTLVMHDHSEAEKLFEDSFKNELSTHRFEPILSNKLKSLRTILAKKIDRSILENTPDQIKDELNNVNRGKIEASEVFKIPNSSILKITLKTSAMADIALKEGFSMFYMHISPHVLSRDDFIELINCYNCFAINEHYKSDCPKENRVICSKCGQNHFYRQCTASPDQYHCINCRGNHSTLSNSCPLRKAKIKQIRNQRKNDNSFVNVVKRSHQSSIRPSFNSNIPQTNPNLSLNPDDWNKTTGIIQIALVSNLVRPGTFSKTYNDLCAENNLPQLSLSSFVPPSKSELQNSGFDPSKIINNILQSPDEFNSDDVQLHSSTIVDNHSHYQSLSNENEMSNAAPANNADSLSVNGTAHDPSSPQAMNTATKAVVQSIPSVTDKDSSPSNTPRNEPLKVQNDIPNTRCIKGFKVKNTRANTPGNILIGVKAKKILFIENDRIITDLKIIEEYLKSNPNDPIESILQAEFNRMMNQAKA